MVKYIRIKGSSSSLKSFGNMAYIISTGYVTVELFFSQDRIKNSIKNSVFSVFFYSLVCHNISNLFLLKLLLVRQNSLPMMQ